MQSKINKLLKSIINNTEDLGELILFYRDSSDNLNFTYRDISVHLKSTFISDGEVEYHQITLDGQTFIPNDIDLFNSCKTLVIVEKDKRAKVKREKEKEKLWKKIDRL